MSRSDISRFLWDAKPMLKMSINTEEQLAKNLVFTQQNNNFKLTETDKKNCIF